MAHKLTDEEQAVQDHATVARAVQELSNSRDLRFLFRQLIRATGAQANAFSSDPALVNYLLGRQSVGQDIIATITEHAPMLWPALIVEENQDVAKLSAEE